MWLEVMHLLIGNAFIGLIEGWLLGIWWHLEKRTAILMMIAANYVSAWVGYWLLRTEFAIQMSRSVPPLYTVKTLLLLVAFAAYLLTIVVEYPFIYSLFRSQTHPFRRALLASWGVQTVSYVALGILFWGAGSVSIYTQTTLDPNYHEWISSPVQIVYVNTERNAVYHYQSATGTQTQLITLPVGDEIDGITLFVRQSQETRQWDLYARVYHRSLEPIEDMVIQRDFARQTAPSSISLYEQDIPVPRGYVRDLRALDHQIWQARTGFYAVEGLLLTNPQTDERLRLALETPFVRWPASHATWLPDDQIIFQLGEQICLFDRVTRKLGSILMGTSPLVVLDEKRTEQSNARDFGPLSPISTYVSRISFWWHIKGVARREERAKAT